jgi:hypothetical protein
MPTLPRALGGFAAAAVAAAALAVPLAGSAQATPGAVKLHTAANLDRFLANVNGLAFMPPRAAGDTRQEWFMEGTAGGFTQLRNVAEPTKCLNAGSAVGKIAFLLTCDGRVAQQWQLGPSGDLKNRNGLVLAVDLANVNQTTRMAPFPTGQLPDTERWHTHAS